MGLPNGRSRWNLQLLVEDKMRAIHSVGSWISTGLNDAWIWVAGLNYQEWFLLLGITSAAGFLCMRGFGSRSEY